MASTNKTPKLGLNQWEPGDEVLREDFNGDNLKIEALSVRSAAAVGTIIGDGIKNRAFDVGFRPSMVVLIGYIGNYNGLGIILGTQFFLTYVNQHYITANDGDTALTDTGFILKDASNFNSLNKSSYYVAFR